MNFTINQYASVIVKILALAVIIETLPIVVELPDYFVGFAIHGKLEIANYWIQIVWDSPEIMDTQFNLSGNHGSLFEFRGT